MAGGVVLQMKGEREIRKALLSLEPKVAKKVIRKAMRSGLKIVQAAAKATVPVQSGQTKRAIKVRAVRKRKKNTIRMMVQIGAGDYKGDTFYGAFPEYGTARQRAQQFMKRAFDQSKDQAAKRIIEELQAGIDAEWNKR